MNQIGQAPTANGDEVMRLRTAFMHWASCVCIWTVLLILSAYIKMAGGLAFFFYFAAGAYLNKAVLPRIVEWHPMYNTLANVTSEKLKLFVFWPLTYLILIVKLGVNKLI
jgi:hypothetical protein